MRRNQPSTQQHVSLEATEDAHPLLQAPQVLLAEYKGGLASRRGRNGQSSEANVGVVPRRPAKIQSRLKLRVKATSLKPTVSATTLSATNPLRPKTKKAELAQLRGHLFNLEEQLRLLQKNPGFDVVTDGSWRHGRIYQQVVEKKPRTALSMWEELSMRQYQQRRASEVENMRLKATLEDQKKVIKSFQRLLQRTKIDVSLIEGR